MLPLFLLPSNQYGLGLFLPLFLYRFLLPILVLDLFFHVKLYVVDVNRVLIIATMRYILGLANVIEIWPPFQVAATRITLGISQGIMQFDSIPAFDSCQFVLSLSNIVNNCHLFFLLARKDAATCCTT